MGSRLDILISGAGIAGLTLARLLALQGIRPVIVERAKALSRTGYALGLWPLGNRVFKGLGLYEEFESISSRLVRFNMANRKGDTEHSYRLERISGSIGPIRMILRSELLELLKPKDDEFDVLYETEVDELSEREGKSYVTFSNGETHCFDLVIGCDGIHSKIRQTIFPDAEPVDTGWSGVGWWPRGFEAELDTMTEYWIPGEAFVATIPAKGRVSAFAGVADVRLQSGASPLACLRESFPDLDSSLFEQEGDEAVYRNRFRYLTMEDWKKGRAVLSGDACSAYFPFGGLGIGASMAIESVAVLADELLRTDAEYIPAALHFYETRRKNRITVFQDAAIGVSDRMLHSNRPLEELLLEQRNMFALFTRMLKEPL